MQKIAIAAPSHNFVGPYLRNEGMYRQSEKKLVFSATVQVLKANTHPGLDFRRRQ